MKEYQASTVIMELCRLNGRVANITEELRRLNDNFEKIISKRHSGHTGNLGQWLDDAERTQSKRDKPAGDSGPR